MMQSGVPQRYIEKYVINTKLLICECASLPEEVL